MAFAYYNEIDPYAAQWLRNLIQKGLIANGYVDERSIEDVQPYDLKGFTQCHFFAGIGVWSAALRLARWPDDRRVWTGSCPCQPFSAAGAGLGFADERHLWPAFFHLITQCRPDRIYGEQVSDRGGVAWLDLVSTDMEAADYAFGALISPVASVGAPHRRHRTDWVADATFGRQPVQRGTLDPWKIRHADSSSDAFSGVDNPHHARFNGQVGDSERQARNETRLCVPDARCQNGGLDNSGNPGLEGHGGGRDGTFRPASPTSEFDRVENPHDECKPSARESERANASSRGSAIGGLADTRCEQRERGQGSEKGGIYDGQTSRRLESDNGLVCFGETGNGPRRPGPVNGLWRDADWLYCRDGKWRPVEPGTFPLAHGATSRVGRLRAYGNAVNLKKTAAFIASTPF